MAEPDIPTARAAALLLAFPWAAELTDEELAAFAAELEGGTDGWPPAAVQHHSAVVVAYWRNRAQSR
jgi:hypothetical protein